MTITPDHPASAPRRRRSDGEQTHAAILEAAMRLASVEGLNSLTIGRLAQELEVSKSGVFAHFRSRQRLQEETIEAAGEIFNREVVAPTMAARKGLARVERYCEAYLSYVERGVFPGGCFFAQLLAEFDAPGGPIHEQVVAGHQRLMRLVQDQIETAQRQGELDPAVDPAQLVFELVAAMEMANYVATLERAPSLVERGRTAVRAALTRAAPRG